ncbi:MULTISPECIES: post-transcriptional regulator [Paenibacillus]|uniref:post-transcriptional regulator n=1 Tax=Paenibacillus TaxID=44249 RepID=UPI000838BC88|nr:MULTISPECIES: post-transcriptional regulator [Paenibacillus]GIP20804.1 histidine kinase [Paenibacillus sp. J22TS3]
MDEEAITEAQLLESIEQLCRSKAEEFQLIGYEHVTHSDIWDCVSSKYEKAGIPPLYQLVNDIMSLKATQFMNYLTLSAYRGSRFD